MIGVEGFFPRGSGVGVKYFQIFLDVKGGARGEPGVNLDYQKEGLILVNFKDIMSKVHRT